MAGDNSSLKIRNLSSIMVLWMLIYLKMMYMLLCVTKGTLDVHVCPIIKKDIFIYSSSMGPLGKVVFPAGKPFFISGGDFADFNKWLPQL